jgi:hypothetical protein
MSVLENMSDLDGPWGAPLDVLRETDQDLIARLVRGILPYLTLLFIIIATTDYQKKHSHFFWGFTAAIITSIVIRVALARLGERVHLLRPGLRNAAFAAAVGLASASAGLVHASALWFYGLESWPFIITMLWIVGCASGSIISLTPSLRLIHLYLWTAWAPVFSLYLWLGGVRGYTVAVATMALLSFLLTQGRALHKAYWQQLRGRTLERTRARELELARAAAEAASLAKS